LRRFAALPARALSAGLPVGSLCAFLSAFSQKTAETGKTMSACLRRAMPVPGGDSAKQRRARPEAAQRRRPSRPGAWPAF